MAEQTLPGVTEYRTSTRLSPALERISSFREVLLPPFRPFGLDLVEAPNLSPKLETIVTHD